MKLLEKATVRPTHLKGLNDFDRTFSPILESSLINTDETRGIQFEHILQVKIGVSFWANTAEYETALKIAEETLARRIYGDAHRLIHEMRQAIMDGDAKRALSVCALMEDEMR